MDMDREELIARIEALRPEIEKIFLQFGAHEPDWVPLEDGIAHAFEDAEELVGWTRDRSDPPSPRPGEIER